MRRIARCSMLTLVLAAGPCLAAEGGASQQSRPLEAFTELDVTGNTDVTIDLTAPLGMRGSERVLKGATVKLAAGKLELGTQTGLTPEKGDAVEVGTPQLKLVRLSGSADIRLLHYQGELLQIELMGSGDVRVEGSCGELQAKLMGSGDIDTSKLAAKRATVTLSGSGDIHVAASDVLDITLSGSGDVDYAGDPATLHQHVSGTGDVKHNGVIIPKASD